MINNNVDFNSLLKNATKDNKNAPPLRMALLADFAAQHLAKAVVAAVTKNGFAATVWQADYDSIASTIVRENSPLYTEAFHYVLVFPSAFKLYKEFSQSQSKQSFGCAKAENLCALLSLLLEHSRARVILCNYDECDDGVWGDYANKTSLSFLSQVRRLNVALMDFAEQHSRVYTVDLPSLVSAKGRTAVYSPQLYTLADLPYTLDFVALLAQKTAQVIAVVEGRFKKCVVLDLDNTLWGGIVGDDGLENLEIGDLGLGKAFSNLQLWLRNLRERGILLAVCSKNNEDTAKRVFVEHEGMVLRLSDIAVFVANWETKPNNIAFIRSVLNIGYDSMVFLDDNPFERGMVREQLPEVTVPELPEDPAEYLPYLQSLHLFETASHTAEDQERTRQYQEEAGRATLQKTFASEAAFLQGLQMRALCEPVNEFTCPRVAQLSQRSNQFNLRTRRYTAEEIAALVHNPQWETLTVSLSDTFGNYGLVSAVLMERRGSDELFIDTWIMSCRVLKRGVENLLLNELVRRAKELGVRRLRGEYLPTAKNELVKDHYASLGFAPAGGNNWTLSVDDFTPLQTFITKTENRAYEH